jgi:hypothetical protein
MRNLLASAARLLIVLASAAACASCLGFLDTDPYWHNPKNAVDRGIDDGSLDEDKIARKIRFEFENYYVEPKTAEGLKNYLLKLGDQCDTQEVIVCTHRTKFSMYVYKYFFSIYLGRSEQSRTEYVVRMSFPKQGDDVIASLAIDVEVKHTNY